MNDRDRIAKRDRIHASIEKMRDLKAERRHENAARRAQAMATLSAEDDIDLDALRASIEAERNAPKLRPVRFYFSDDPSYDGFTDDTYWNGFLNVWVTPETHKQVMADHPIEDSDHDYWDIAPDSSGLISYAGGFATSEDE